VLRKDTLAAEWLTPDQQQSAIKAQQVADKGYKQSLIARCDTWSLLIY
jgi:hypothetical protein